MIAEWHGCALALIIDRSVPPTAVSFASGTGSPSSSESQAHRGVGSARVVTLPNRAVAERMRLSIDRPDGAGAIDHRRDDGPDADQRDPTSGRSGLGCVGPWRHGATQGHLAGPPSGLSAAPSSPEITVSAQPRARFRSSCVGCRAPPCRALSVVSNGYGADPGVAQPIGEAARWVCRSGL